MIPSNIKKLLNSKFPEDRAIGYTLLYQEVGEDEFVRLLTIIENRYIPGGVTGYCSVQIGDNWYPEDGQKLVKSDTFDIDEYKDDLIIKLR